jgi:uncharacterized membrane protein (UPF0127 family)
VSHFLRPLLEPHHTAQLVDERTGVLVAAVLETAFDSATRRRGLLGRDDLDDGRALVLAPCNAIHTCRMRFPIDVLFVDRDGRVTKIVERLGAWRVAASFSAFATIELRAGAADGRNVTVGDRLALRSATCDVRLARDIRLGRSRRVDAEESARRTDLQAGITKHTAG